MGFRKKSQATYTKLFPFEEKRALLGAMFG